MGFRNLIKMTDKQIREDIGEFYYIEKSRMENIIIVVEKSAERIKELSKIVADQQEQIVALTKVAEWLEKENDK